MAKKNGEQRLRLRISGADDVNHDGKSRQKILKYYFDQYKEPELTFGLPEGKGGNNYDASEPVAILANGEVVGFLDERDRVLFEDNVDRAVRGYVDIREVEAANGESGNVAYEAEAVIVLNHIITEKEKRKNELTRKSIIWTAVLVLGSVTGYNVIKGYWMEFLLSSVLFALVVYVGLIRKPPKRKDFYQLP